MLQLAIQLARSQGGKLSHCPLSYANTAASTMLEADRAAHLPTRRHIQKLPNPRPELSQQLCSAEPTQVRSSGHPEGRQLLLHLKADPRQRPHRQGCHKCSGQRGRQHGLVIRLVQARGQLGQHLVARDTGGAAEPSFRLWRRIYGVHLPLWRIRHGGLHTCCTESRLCNVRHLALHNDSPLQYSDIGYYSCEPPSYRKATRMQKTCDPNQQSHDMHGQGPQALYTAYHVAAVCHHTLTAARISSARALPTISLNSQSKSVTSAALTCACRPALPLLETRRSIGRCRLSCTMVACRMTSDQLNCIAMCLALERIMYISLSAAVRETQLSC